MRRHELSDDEWAIIQPLLPNKPRGVPRVDDRRVLNGILWRFRTGAPWRDIPERYGPRTTLYNRFLRWRAAGVWDRILAAVSEAYETREETEKLLREDPSLFDRGGGRSAGQTGEEYRQTLRKATAQDPDKLRKMPWGIGSGMRKGEATGVFFCASVGDRTYLRFLPTDQAWTWGGDPSTVQREIGTCLRLIECDEATPRVVPSELENAAFDLWEIARRDMWDAWMFETDPANLQPTVRPLNLRVAEFIRANRPHDDSGDRVNHALDILEAPWPRREEILLREWFGDESSVGADKARRLVSRIVETGLEPFNQPKLLPPIQEEDVRLVCWLGISGLGPGDDAPLLGS